MHVADTEFIHNLLSTRYRATIDHDHQVSGACSLDESRVASSHSCQARHLSYPVSKELSGDLISKIARIRSARTGVKKNL